MDGEESGGDDGECITRVEGGRWGRLEGVGGTETKPKGGRAFASLLPPPMSATQTLSATTAAAPTSASPSSYKVTSTTSGSHGCSAARARIQRQLDEIQASLIAERSAAALAAKLAHPTTDIPLVPLVPGQMPNSRPIPPPRPRARRASPPPPSPPLPLSTTNTSSAAPVAPTDSPASARDGTNPRLCPWCVPRLRLPPSFFQSVASLI